MLHGFLRWPFSAGPGLQIRGFGALLMKAEQGVVMVGDDMVRKCGFDGARLSMCLCGCFVVWIL
jgi:hypothetical protein